MRFTFYSALFVLVFLQLLLPVIALLWVGFRRNRSKLAWGLKIMVTAPYIALLILSGYWQQFSYYSRWVLAVLYIIAFIKSCTALPKLPLYERTIYIDWFFALAGISIAILLFTNLFQAVKASTAAEQPVNLHFPFKEGTFMISFGGNGDISPLVNYHYRIPLYSRSKFDPSVKYAVDIIKLNKFGRSSDGLLSLDNQSYEIFGETVYSPCDGEILSVEDRWTDERPFAYNYPYNPGNSIIIKYKEVLILFGHLEKGSILVKPGDLVKSGQALAKVGNSGWTTEPHLHFQVMNSSKDLEGEGIPFLFDGRFPIKNELFIQ